MKFRVNENCIGCGLCEGICPEVFEMSEEGVAKAMDEEVDSSVEGSAMDAKNSCPVNAIESME